MSAHFSRCLTALILLLAACARRDEHRVLRSYNFPRTTASPDTLLKEANRYDSLGRSGDKEYRAVAAIFKGVYFNRKGQSRLAQKTFQSGLNTLGPKGSEIVRSELFIRLGNTSAELGSFADALQYYSKALKHSTDSLTQGRVYAYIGQVFQLKGDLPHAREALQHALALSGQDPANRGYLVALHTLANVYGMAGKIDSAMHLDEEGIRIANTQELLSYKGSFFDNKALCFLETKQLDSARHYFLQSLAIDSALDNKKQMADSWLNLGLLADRSGNRAEAIQLLQQSIHLSQAIGYRLGVVNGYQYLAETYAGAGDHQRALEAYNQQSRAKDSLVSEKSENAIAEWKAFYETERKDKELKVQGLQLRQKNLLIAFGSLSAGLLFAAIYFANRRAKLRKEKVHQRELYLRDQDAALKVMAAEEAERRRIAADLHDGVGQTLTAAWLNLQATQPLHDNLEPEYAQLLRITAQLVSDSCAEVRQVSHNMMPVVLFHRGLIAALEELVGRIHGKQLEVSFSAEGYVAGRDKTAELVLYRIIQECVNNAVRHAEASALYISIHQDDEQLAVLIEDNGKGMQGRSFVFSAGLGLQSVRSRVQFLRGSVEWNSVLPDGSGTIVEIYIPLTS